MTWFDHLTGHILVLAEPTATANRLLTLVPQQGYTVEQESWSISLDGICSASLAIPMLDLLDLVAKLRVDRLITLTKAYAIL